MGRNDEHTADALASCVQMSLVSNLSLTWRSEVPSLRCYRSVLTDTASSAAIPVPGIDSHTSWLVFP